jgi:hypothetical protein
VRQSLGGTGDQICTLSHRGVMISLCVIDSFRLVRAPAMSASMLVRFCIPFQ